MNILSGALTFLPPLTARSRICVQDTHITEVVPVNVYARVVNVNVKVRMWWMSTYWIAQSQCAAYIHI